MIRANTYSRLQEDVLLVTWDQRGTARSYSDAIAPETLTVSRLLDDALELVDWVRRAFERDRVHLLGHSWGGCLALLLAHRHPQALASVFALCPFINLERSAAVAYSAMISRAQSRNDHAALTELRELGVLPYADLQSAMAVHTKWIIEYGGMVHGGPERVGELFGRFENVPGYSASDYENAARGPALLREASGRGVRHARRLGSGAGARGSTDGRRRARRPRQCDRGDRGVVRGRQGTVEASARV